MSWTINKASFHPDPGCETLGTITANYAAGGASPFSYTASINLDIPETLISFLNDAEAARLHQVSKQQKLDAAFAAGA